jgi:hypothetical protein
MPEAPPAPPKPQAPPPAPSAPAAPPPASAASPDLSKQFDASFPDDGLDTAPEPPPPAPEPPKAKKEAKGKADEPVPDKGKAGDEPAKGAASPEGGEFAAPNVAKPSELRNWANRMGARAQKAESEIASLKSKLTQLESQPPKQSEDNANLAQQLAAANKKLEQYENDIRLTNYERSAEYRDKYEKPYKDAIVSAYDDVKELIVYEPNPDGEGEPVERAATQADFNEIYALPLGQATRLAKTKFGDAAPIVLQHRANIRRLAQTAYAAVEEYKSKAGEVETKTRAERAQREEAMSSMFNAATEGHAKRTPDLYMERDGDNEGNELLAKGKQFASAVFGGNEGLTPQQVAFRDAMAYNRLSAYPRLVRDVRRLKLELEKANAAIDGLKGGGPGKPEGGKSSAGEQPAEGWSEAFDKLPG